MPRILLVMPIHRKGDKTFPFGIATIYSQLKDRKYDVDLCDCVVEGKSFPELIRPAEIRRYDIIGIGGLISSYKRVKEEIVPFIREHAPGALVLIGGYLGVSVPEMLLRRGLCDVCFLGDAEESIFEFLKVRGRREEWKSVAGIAYLDEDGSMVNTGIRRLESLEASYIPYYKYMDIDKYNAHRKERERAYPLVVEVGCIYNCNFCFNSSRNKPRSRNPGHVIAEIKTALGKFKFRKVDLMSENLLSRPRWVAEFCERIRQDGLRFQWEACGHARTLNDDILKLVKRHGCTEIGIGFENFSQKLLDNMNKRVKVEDNVRALRLLRRNRLKYSGTMIFGYLGEDRETVEDNVRICRECAYSGPYYWIQAYPMTVLYAQCLERGIIRNEEEYIEKLGDITDFVINLTGVSDGELAEMRNYLNDSIRINRRDWAMYPRLYRNYGLGYLLQFMLRALRNSSSMRY